MEYWTKYFSTLFKGRFMLTQIEKWHARSENAHWNRGEHAFDKMVEKVTLHLASKGERLQDKALHEWLNAVHAGGLLAMENAIEDQKVMQLIHRIVTSIGHARKALDKMEKSPKKLEHLRELHEAEQIFAISMLRGLENARKKVGKEYQEVNRLLKEAVDEKGVLIVDKLREILKGGINQKWMARFAIQRDLDQEAHLWRDIEKLAVEMEVLEKELEKIAEGKSTNHTIEELIKDLKDFARKGEVSVEKVNYEAYFIKRRDFVILLGILLKDKELEHMDEKWVATYFMPKGIIAKEIPKAAKIREMAEEDLKVVSEGLRILVHNMEQAKTELKRVTV